MKKNIILLEDRRFHAQPNACPVCGPHVELKVKSEKLKVNEKENPVKETIRLLREGYIVAIKGLGGFHLACDASNEKAVNTLRLRKRKSNKPFALMAPDLNTVKKFCNVSREEENLLTSMKRPIVLLTKKEALLPEGVSPKNPCIGFMLPYTPLHYMLFYYPLIPPSPPFSKGGMGGFKKVELGGITTNFDALVMTSGNIAEEPLVIHNDEAVAKLSGIADAFLLHNRDIFMRVDDSVVRIMEEKETEKRRCGDAEKSNISDSPSHRFAVHFHSFVVHGDMYLTLYNFMMTALMSLDAALTLKMFSPSPREVLQFPVSISAIWKTMRHYCFLKRVSGT